jgi:hypothetical protein
MGRLHGKRGIVYLGQTFGSQASPIAYLSDWEVDWALAWTDVTSIRDRMLIQVPSLDDASGSFSGFYDDATSQTYVAATDGYPRNFYLYPDMTNSQTFVSGLIIADFAAAGGVNAAASVKATWASAGGVTFTQGFLPLSWAAQIAGAGTAAAASSFGGWRVSGALAGAGTARATASVSGGPVQATAQIAGAGTAGAASTVLVQATAQIAGAGTAGAASTVSGGPVQATAGIAGAGTASARAAVSSTATLAGAGTATATATVRSTAALAGAGAAGSGSAVTTAGITYSFEGGTNGAAVTTTSAGTGDTNFDAVTLTTPGTDFLNFDSTQAHSGTLSCKVSTSGTSHFALARWGPKLGAGGYTQLWVRAYVYYSGTAPAGNYRIVAWYNTSGGATICGSLVITTTGTIRALNASGGTMVSTTTTLSTGWNRIEGYLIGDAASGSAQIQIYVGANVNGTTPDQTVTSTTSATAGTISSVQFGQSGSSATVFTYWLDDIGASSTGYMGP